MLALGIGLQNFPEGLAVSVPLRREGAGRGRAFFMGQLSGAVEPVAGVIGAALVLSVQRLLPYMLAFAAGAMIYVVVAELIPESQSNERSDIMAIAHAGGILGHDGAGRGAGLRHAGSGFFGHYPQKRAGVFYAARY